VPGGGFAGKRKDLKNGTTFLIDRRAAERKRRRIRRKLPKKRRTVRNTKRSGLFGWNIREPSTNRVRRLPLLLAKRKKAKKNTRTIILGFNR